MISKVSDNNSVKALNETIFVGFGFFYHLELKKEKSELLQFLERFRSKVAGSVPASCKSKAMH